MGGVLREEVCVCRAGGRAGGRGLVPTEGAAVELRLPREEGRGAPRCSRMARPTASAGGLLREGGARGAPLGISLWSW